MTIVSLETMVIIFWVIVKSNGTHKKRHSEMASVRIKLLNQKLTEGAKRYGQE